MKLGPKYGLGETSKEEAEAREAVTSRDRTRRSLSVDLRPKPRNKH